MLPLRSLASGGYHVVPMHAQCSCSTREDGVAEYSVRVCHMRRRWDGSAAAVSSGGVGPTLSACEMWRQRGDQLLSTRYGRC